MHLCAHLAHLGIRLLREAINVMHVLRELIKQIAIHFQTVTIAVRTAVEEHIRDTMALPSVYCVQQAHIAI